MTVKSPDKRALKILFDAYWSPAGWRYDIENRLSQEDFAYAKSMGLMFDAMQVGHAEALEWLSHGIHSIDRRKVVDAFLASLSTRRLDWRSALGSFAVFQHLESHEPEVQGGYCGICGHYPNSGEQDFNVLNFERFKWGGVRHDHVVYAAMDLGLFAKETVPAPTEQDIAIFRNLVQAIRLAPPETSSAKLQTLLSTAFRSNKDERDRLIGILGFCGILATPDHPGFSEKFIPYNRRDVPSRRFVDMAYPACWWQTDVGINQSQLEAYFGHVL